MQTYKAVFSTRSVLTQLPSAQTLFGAFCSSLKDLEGKEKLLDYLHSLESEPWFVHSSMLPDGLFPAPRQNIFPLEAVSQAMPANQPARKLEVLSNFKRYKKIRYISEGVFTRFILVDGLKSLRKEIAADSSAIRLDEESGILYLDHESISFHIAGSTLVHNACRKNGLDMEKDLYYTRVLYPAENQRFAVYLHIDDQQPEMKERVLKLLKMLEWQGVGPRRSSGLNSFHLESFDPISCSSSADLKLLLSECLPDQDIDFKNSFYQVDSFIYRGSKSYNYGNFTGRYSLLTCGSMIASDKPRQYFGKVEQVLSAGKPVYHYGIGMVM